MSPNAGGGSQPMSKAVQMEMYSKFNLWSPLLLSVKAKSTNHTERRTFQIERNIVPLSLCGGIGGGGVGANSTSIGRAHFVLMSSYLGPTTSPPTSADTATLTMAPLFPLSWSLFYVCLRSIAGYKRVDHRVRNIEWSTELVQDSTQRGTPHRSNVATRHMIDIVWFNSSPRSGEGWSLILAHGDYCLPAEGEEETAAYGVSLTLSREALGPIGPSIFKG
jgi:hypothetical protein